MAARWVPRLLMEDQEANRIIVCERRYRTKEVNDFLRHIITCDEASLQFGVEAGKHRVAKT